MMIVVISPRSQHRARFVQRSKLMHVQTFVTQSSVEELDEPILRRLAWPDEVELHAAQVTLLIQHLGRKFRSMIDSYRMRQLAFERDLIHRNDDTLPRQTVVSLQGHALTMPFVDHREHPELPPVGQLVMDKIYCPILTGRGRGWDRSPVQTDALPATDSHTNLEPLQLVQPVHALAA